jgi:hypothetical protein
LPAHKGEDFFHLYYYYKGRHLGNIKTGGSNLAYTFLCAFLIRHQR